MKAVFCAIMLAGAVSVLAQSNIVITSLGQNGELTWSDRSDVSRYTVEWAPSANGPWTNSWVDLEQIWAGSNSYVAQVPMFYRIVGQQAGTKLLLHMDGADGSTTITDNVGHAVNVSGVGAHLATNSSKFGGSSLFLNGDAGGGGVTVAASPDLALGTNDFTIDTWIKADAYPGATKMILQCGLIGDWSVEGGGWFIGYMGATYDAVNSTIAFSTFMYGLGTSSVEADILAPASDAEQWHHLAYVRKGGRCTVFFDGKEQVFGQFNVDLKSIGPIAVCWNQWGDAGNPPRPRYADEVRILGYAQWTKSFTPPDRPYAR